MLGLQGLGMRDNNIINNWIVIINVNKIVQIS